MKRLLLALCLLGGAVSAEPNAPGGVPSFGTLLGARDSTGAMAPVKVCDKSTPINVSLSAGVTSTAFLFKPGNGKLFTCGFYFGVSSSTQLAFVEGQGTNCLTAGSLMTAPAYVLANSGISLTPSPFAVAFSQGAGNNFCLWASATTTVSGWLTYNVAP